MKRFVLDASFAVSWVVESERTPERLRFLDALTSGKAEAFVPALWADEMGNVLLTLERAKKLNATQVAAWVEVYCRLPIEIDPPSIDHSLGDVYRIARAHGLSVYDACYLHLALREKLPLATLDRELLKSAAKVGVESVL